MKLVKNVMLEKNLVPTIYLCKYWYVHVPRSVQTIAIAICVYERSMCRYVRLNALNVPHVPWTLFIAPHVCLYLNHTNSLTNSCSLHQNKEILFSIHSPSSGIASCVGTFWVLMYAHWDLAWPCYYSCSRVCTVVRLLLSRCWVPSFSTTVKMYLVILPILDY